MREFTVILIALILGYNGSYAQELQTEIYFENGIGEKDTLVVGYDNAANNGLNDEFDSDCLEEFSNENFGVLMWDNNSNYLPTVDEIESNLVNWSKKNIVKKSCQSGRGTVSYTHLTLPTNREV